MLMRKPNSFEKIPCIYTASRWRNKKKNKWRHSAYTEKNPESETQDPVCSVRQRGPLKSPCKSKPRRKSSISIYAPRKSDGMQRRIEKTVRYIYTLFSSSSREKETMQKRPRQWNKNTRLDLTRCVSPDVIYTRIYCQTRRERERERVEFIFRVYRPVKLHLWQEYVYRILLTAFCETRESRANGLSYDDDSTTLYTANECAIRFVLRHAETLCIFRDRFIDRFSLLL